MAKKKKTIEPMNLNLTSMMDIVFQLIIFFILITNFSSQELPEIQPPQFDSSVAQDIPEENKIMVNVVTKTGRNRKPEEYSKFTAVYVGRFKFDAVPDTDREGNHVKISDEDREAIIEMLKSEQARKAQELGSDEEVRAVLRADGRIEYQYVAMAMKLILKAGIKKTNIVAEIEDD